MTDIRIRFAPSPTGYLHVGGARTALFNWLYARKHKGTFILRIEDTDQARSTEEMTQGILDGMRWLGLSWDEGPYFQTQRSNLYQQAAEDLVRRRKAYRCFCTPQRLTEMQTEAQKGGRTWKYDRACLALTGDQIAKNIDHGLRSAIRFRVPEGKTEFDDVVFGHIEIQNENIEDFVLLRSAGVPTYHLSVVVDDIDMKITTIIRGADHIPNTPKQVLLYAALDKALPQFAHLPLILGPDKQRLSKRHGATSVTAYQEMGCLPEAVVNFLALLGWAPGENRELLSLAEMIELFSLNDVHKTNAVFDLKKLEWMNSQYLHSIPAERLFALVKEQLSERGVWDEQFETTRRERFVKTLELLRPRAKMITDFVDLGIPFFTDAFEYEAAAVEKSLNEPKLLAVMAEFRERLAALPSFELHAAEQEIKTLAEEFSLKPAALMGALRVGLTGRSNAPGIFEIMSVLGRETVLERIDRLIAFLQTRFVPEK